MITIELSDYPTKIHFYSFHSLVRWGMEQLSADDLEREANALWEVEKIKEAEATGN
jgi:hypothetical protein